MYIVNAKDLKGVAEDDIQARMDIVEYLKEWSADVYKGAKDRKTISLAGRYIRSRILEKGSTFEEMLNAVVVIDLMDFWRAVDGYNGKRDDMNLYGIFCILFSEVNEEMKEESKKLEGSIGFAPRVRFDISERTMSEVVDTKELAKKKKRRKKKQVESVPKESKGVKQVTEVEDVNEESVEEEEDGIVEIKDKYVTPKNVTKLTIGAVSVISILMIVLVWMLLF